METFFTISNGERNTPCILREPDTGRPRRVVIGVHGIAGCKEDPIQESIAEEMDLFGCAILRFDLPAHGENDEEILSLHGCVDTLLDVADYAAERYPDLKDRIFGAMQRYPLPEWEPHGRYKRPKDQ